MVKSDSFEWYANAELFADHDDSNPFAVNPREELGADASPLRETESYLTWSILQYVDRVTGGRNGPLKPMVSLAVEETYARLGYPHAVAHADPLKPHEGPTHEELRELPDPTPEDFRDTLRDICDEPEEFVRSRQVAERTGNDALSLLRNLPQADNDKWDPGRSDQHDDEDDQPANQSEHGATQ